MTGRFGTIAATFCIYSSIMVASIDRLSALLEQFPVRSEQFHQGPLCGEIRFEAQPGRAFLHILRSGALVVTHEGGDGASVRLVIAQPTLLFYPRATVHEFQGSPGAPPDLTCATVAFAGGDAHPIARALPPVVAVPLAEVTGLEPSLALLFSETGQVRCGSRLLADRLFEIVLLQLLRWILDQGIASVGLVAGLGDPKLARALTAVHEQPARDWTLTRLAGIAGMSRSAFSSRFHAVLGITPADYIAEWRLSRASTLLRQGKRLALVADAVGYSSHAALSRAFKQRRGLSPSQWLRGQP